ncbi:substrate-binding domain-containing protein, partial [Muricomes intestini]
MKKKVISALLCAAMIGTMVIGCGSKGDSSASDKGGDDSSSKAKEDLSIEIVSKGFQHQYWQAVLKGSTQKADELGVKINFVGPNSESDIADQVQMLQSAINAQPDA